MSTCCTCLHVHLAFDHNLEEQLSAHQTVSPLSLASNLPLLIFLYIHTLSTVGPCINKGDHSDLLVSELRSEGVLLRVLEVP